MKILSLRFKNLNALYGEWVIDLTHPEYTTNGIFAITGPTGAGKSTLLDAICLALYGRTPRLKTISRSTNEVMSRQSAECFAEVVFQSQAGCFRCHWSQSRAYRRVDGALQESKHEIADGITGRIIESRKKNVQQVIEEKTGMDFDRFTRSVLLAQGNFAIFLQASADERAPVLEQITGTEIYSEISIKVHECQKEAQSGLNLLMAEYAGLTSLTDDEKKIVIDQLETELSASEQLQDRYKNIDTSIHWLTSCQEKITRIAALEDEAEMIRQQQKDFAPQQAELDAALQAAELEGAYQLLNAVITEINKNEPHQTQLEEQKDQLETDDTSIQIQWSELKKAYEEKKTEQKALQSVLKQVRILDVQLSECQQNIEKNQDHYQKLQAEYETEHQKITELIRNEKKLKEELGHYEDYLNQHAHDGGLQSELTGIAAEVNALMILSQTMATAKTALVHQEDEVKTQQAVCIKNQQHLDKVQAEYRQVTQDLQAQQETLAHLLGDRPLSAYREKQQALQREQFLVSKVIQLEAERAKLQAGSPCPLCGSKSHPYVRGTVPELSGIEHALKQLDEQITAAEKLELAVKTAHDRQFDVTEQKHAAQMALDQSRLHAQLTSKHIKEQETQYALLQQQYAKQEAAFYDCTAPWQPSDMRIQPEILLPQLQKRQQQWQQQQTALQTSERALVHSIRERENGESLVARIQTMQSQLQQDGEQHQKIYQERYHARVILFGTRNADRVETEFEEILIHLEKQVRAQEETRQQITARRVTVVAELEALYLRLNELKVRRDQLQRQLLDRLPAKGFVDLTHFISSQRPIEVRNRLQQQADKLKEAQVANAITLKNQQESLSRARQKNVTEESLETLIEQRTIVREQNQHHIEVIGALKQQLKQNALIEKTLADRQVQIEKQQEALERWQNLHRLIGSADGKKYRNFAQGLTFELMIAYANEQLEKMTDRYLLTCNHDLPLDLDVIDHYQAGEIRSTRNLSGGESFIVSLALALGLSKMSSQKVRVDALFLDEGFGTLDEEALDTALEVLASVQQEDKLMGIISHVPALKERISTQISVLPVANGVSRLAGAGIRKISS